MNRFEFAALHPFPVYHGPVWSYSRCATGRHEDRNPSLSFRDGDAGLIVKCHAGCTFAEIARAVGRPQRDFFYNGAPPSPTLRPVQHQTAQRTERAANGSTGRRLVARYQYCDENGAVLYEVRRYEPKGFTAHRPDGRGGWIGDLDSVQRVLYRLPALQGRKTAYVVEGEKDTDTLWRVGIPATTSPWGAKGWDEKYTRQLVAAGVQQIVILPDNDAAGTRYAEAVATSCLAAGSR
jgi:Toprim domain-containing protein